MDVLINGDELERTQFSFALIDINKSGTINFQEFFNHIKQVVAHWSSLVNSHVRVDKQEIRSTFTQLDLDNDGVISFKEYFQALRKNPDLLDWFELLNSAKETPGKNKTETVQSSAEKAKQERIKAEEKSKAIEAEKKKMQEEHAKEKARQAQLE